MTPERRDAIRARALLVGKEALVHVMDESRMRCILCGVPLALSTIEDTWAASRDDLELRSEDEALCDGSDL